jgi:hypothetical protein
MPGQPDLGSLFAALGQLIFIVYAAAGLSAGIAQWALADYFTAHMDTEQNTRELVELMRSRRGGPPTGAAYNRQLNGMWADQPSQRRAPPPYEPSPVEQYMKRQNKGQS